VWLGIQGIQAQEPAFVSPTPRLEKIAREADDRAMTFEEIRHALETAERIPREALAAAPGYAHEVLPLVIEAARKLAGGIEVAPGENNMLLYGVHVLAAARVTAFWTTWLDLLRAPDGALEAVFGDGVMPVAAGVTLALVGEDPDGVFDVLAAPEMDALARVGVFGALARLTWEGRVERTRTHDFLARFEREGLIAEEDLGWLGWVDAVLLLGLDDLTGAVRRVFAKEAFALHRAEDFRGDLERLAAAAADPPGRQRYDDEGFTPIDDPVEGMAWLARIEASEDAAAARRARAPARGPDASRGYPRHDRAEPRRSAKVGRNEPCPCGSGRKFKKCCGA
jgi:hypothetical protein